MEKTWLLVSFAPITSSMLPDSNIPTFCSRMFGDTWKILTAYDQEQRPCTRYISQSFIHSAPSSFSANGCFYFCKEEEIWKTSYWNILQNDFWAVAESLEDRSHITWVPHTLFMLPLCVTTHTLYVALCGVHDPEQSSGRHAGVNHWNEPGQAILYQIFSLSKSKPALSKTRQVEKAEEPTLSQRYLIYSHVPPKLITHLQI